MLLIHQLVYMSALLASARTNETVELNTTDTLTNERLDTLDESQLTSNRIISSIDLGFLTSRTKDESLTSTQYNPPIPTTASVLFASHPTTSYIRAYHRHLSMPGVQDLTNVDKTPAGINEREDETLSEETWLSTAESNPPCREDVAEGIQWNETEAGTLAVAACPSEYLGSLYRSCSMAGQWEQVDYSQCRLKYLEKMGHLITYHIERSRFDGLQHLTGEFADYLRGTQMVSPADRLLALYMLDDVLKSNGDIRINREKDRKYVQALLTACDVLLGKNMTFSYEQEKNDLIRRMGAEILLDLTFLADKILRTVSRVKKKHLEFFQASNIATMSCGLLSNMKNTFETEMHIFTSEENQASYLLLRNESFETQISNISYKLNLSEEENQVYLVIRVKKSGDVFDNKEYSVNSDIVIVRSVSGTGYSTSTPFDIVLKRLKLLNFSYTYSTHFNSQRSRLYQFQLNVLFPSDEDVELKLVKAAPLTVETEKDYLTPECGILETLKKLWTTEHCNLLSHTNEFYVCRCHHLGGAIALLERPVEASHPTSSLIVSKSALFSCAISLAAVLFTLVVHIAHFRDLPESSVILLNIVISIAITQVAFMTGVSATENSRACHAVALILHYFHLVTCFWLLTYTVHLYRLLNKCPDALGKGFYISSWVLPLFVVLISLTINPKGYETTRYCWLSIHRGMVLSFIVPVTLLILINTVITVISLKTFFDQRPIIHKSEIDKMRISLRTSVTLLPFAAINWFFGVLSLEDTYTNVFQYTYSFTNSAQGILIFVYFCLMDKEITHTWRSKLKWRGGRKKLTAMKLKRTTVLSPRPTSLATINIPSRDSQPLLINPPVHYAIVNDPCCSNVRV